MTTQANTPRVILGYVKLLLSVASNDRKRSHLSHNSIRQRVNRTMNFGLEGTKPESSSVRVQGVAKVKPLLDAFVAHGHVEVDSARIYCSGDTEKVPMPSTFKPVFIPMTLDMSLTLSSLSSIPVALAVGPWSIGH